MEEYGINCSIILGTLRDTYLLMQVHTEGRTATIDSLQGGNMIDIAKRISLCEDSRPDMIMDALITSRPMQLSTNLWDLFCRKFNYSQLYAIKHIVQMDFGSSQDTHVALIQGPPGTG